MPKFTFEARIYCTFSIEAENEADAVDALMSAEMETGNLGVLPDGSPIVASLDIIEDGSGGDWSALPADQ